MRDAGKGIVPITHIYLIFISITTGENERKGIEITET